MLSLLCALFNWCQKTNSAYLRQPRVPDRDLQYVEQQAWRHVVPLLLLNSGEGERKEGRKKKNDNVSEAEGWHGIGIGAGGRVRRDLTRRGWKKGRVMAGRGMILEGDRKERGKVK